MEQLNNLDVVFLIIVGVSALVGIARGMTKELLSVIGWILAAAALIYLVPMVDPVMQKYIASKILSGVVSGMVVLVVFSIVWILTVDKIATVIRFSKLSALDRILGFFFGAARGILIVILLALMLTTIIPEETKKGIFAESKYFTEASESAEPLKTLIPDSWVEKFKAQSESLGFGSKTANAETDDSDKKDKKSDTKKSKGEDNKAASGENTNKSETSKKIEAIDANIEVLKKSGEELFKQLAQPKTAEGEADLLGAASDLDKLLDMLEDNIVETETQNTEIKSDTQKVTDKLKKSGVTEKVADKVQKK